MPTEATLGDRLSNVGGVLAIRSRYQKLYVFGYCRAGGGKLPERDCFTTYAVLLTRTKYTERRVNGLQIGTLGRLRGHIQNTI